MKRFILRLLFLAALGYLVWRLSEASRSAPVGSSPASGPAPTPPVSHRPRPHEVTPDPISDDLQRVKGIGPAYAARLREQGITSFAGLRVTDANVIADALDVAPTQVTDWQEQARALD